MSDLPSDDSLAAPRAQVIPLGRVNQVACAVAAANLQAILGLACGQEAVRPLDQEAYLAVRRQYNAEKLLIALEQDLPPGLIRVGVTDGDLCLPVLSYVYGQAMVGGRTALVSTHRLGGDDRQQVPRDLLYERLAKVVCHEAAHALGLEHCRQPGCLMRFSAGLENLDALELHFCPTCRVELARRRQELNAPEAGSSGNRPLGESD